MTDVSSNESESSKADNKPVTVGMRLREERLSRGIKRSEIAIKLHITNHYVKSIEDNNFEKITWRYFR
jgi:cytoskeletal protein RodZ